MPDTEKTNPGGVERRSVLKGAAWSVPVIAAAVAAPLAAASTNNASLAWTGRNTNLITVQLLSGGTVNTALGIAVTVPTQFTLTNGQGAISASATVTVVVGRPLGINLTNGAAHGFGVYSLNGVNVASQNTTSYNKQGNKDVGFPITTFTGTQQFSNASNASAVIPIVFGLSGTHDNNVTIALLATFPVSLTVAFAGGGTYTASTTISVPISAGIL